MILDKFLLSKNIEKHVYLKKLLNLQTLNFRSHRAVHLYIKPKLQVKQHQWYALKIQLIIMIIIDIN